MATETLANDEQRAQLAAYLIEAMRQPSTVRRSGPSTARNKVRAGDGPAPRAQRQRFILFAPELVQAILDGRKTITRRIAKDPNDPCPFGVVGDSLWVREKWGYRDEFFDARKRHCGPFVYASGGPPAGAKRMAWRPSLHMPREACRVILHITAARAERLNRITPADAMAEGCPEDHRDDPIAWFQALWDGLTPDRQKSWQANPWVWVICFDVRILSPT